MKPERKTSNKILVAIVTMFEQAMQIRITERIEISFSFQKSISEIALLFSIFGWQEGTFQSHINNEITLVL